MRCTRVFSLHLQKVHTPCQGLDGGSAPWCLALGTACSVWLSGPIGHFVTIFSLTVSVRNIPYRLLGSTLSPLMGGAIWEAVETER